MENNLIQNRHINDVISEIYFKNNQLKQDNSEVSFDIISSLKIIKQATQLFENEPSVLQINAYEGEDIVVVGDIHGNIESLINIFQAKGDPSITKYLFLGDYVDRGQNSCEVIVLLYAFKCLYPENIHLIRGNHEFRSMNDHYGFKEECYKRIKIKVNDKYMYGGQKFYDIITDSFQYLPICAILNEKVFCVHGGITALVEEKSQLMNIQKVGADFTKYDSVQAELLWNDPDPNVKTYKRSPRGLGCVFGDEALNDFLQKMDFNVVIRAHQNQMNGYDWTFGENGGILTVFSSSDYCGTSNDGAVATVSSDCNVIPCKFELELKVLIPELIIQNNLSFLDDITLNPDFNIDEIPCLI